MNIKLKRASIAQTDELMPLILDFYKSENIVLEAHQIRSSLEKLLENNLLGFILTASVENKIIGYSTFTFGFDMEYGGRDAWVTDFFITDEFRKQGLGHMLMENVEKESIKNDVKAIHLMVSETNIAANRLYAKRGFQNHPRAAMMKQLRNLK